MTETPPRPTLSTGELVPMLALLISLAAMAIDSMLPALGLIGRDLGVANANDTQLVVSALFLGMSLGQAFIGPLSDSVGRKRAIYAALAVFITGTLISMTAHTFTAMLVGRVLQGAGAAGPRIVVVALVRDQYGGRAMARIMSVIMAVFIVVPALAPSIGQAVLWVADWRMIFGFLLLQATVAGLWFSVRHPETLPPAKRMAFSVGRIARAVAETVRTRIALGYTVAAGLVFGQLLGYLSTAQQIFVGQYGVGDAFPLYFGALALALGSASVVNSRIVVRLGMHTISRRALLTQAVLSCAFLAIAYAQDGAPPLWQLMAYLMGAFFCLGMLFGNFNALAMEPLAHIAGTAAAVIGSLSTFISLGFGVAIGRTLDDTVLPLVAGFAGLGIASFAVMAWTERAAPEATSPSR